MEKTLRFVVIYRKKGDIAISHNDFETEAEARDFARTKESEGYMIFSLFDTSTDTDLMPGIVGLAGFGESHYERYIYTPANRKKLNQENRKGYWLMLKFYGKKSLYIVAAIGLGVLIKKYSGITFAPTTMSIFVVLAAFFYSTSTLGFLVGESLKVWEGQSTPEKTNEWILIIAYSLGTLFTVLSLSF